MIQITEETMMSMTEASEWLKTRGITANRVTLYGWASPSGCSGVRLESLKVGKRLHTSREALQRFCEQLTELYLPV